MSTKLILTIVVVSLIVCGCGKKQESAATPKDAMSKFIEGILEFDKAKFMGSLTGTEMEMKAASAFMDYMISVSDFKEAVIDKYGSSGWAHFEKEGGAKLSLDMTDNRDKLDSMKVEIEGDKAVCTMPGEAKAVNLLRKNGVWYVNASNVVTTGGMSHEKFIETWTKMNELIKSKQRRIGQPGVTAQSLDMELGNEMIAILTGNR
jgi:urease beta subunit